MQVIIKVLNPTYIFMVHTTLSPQKGTIAYETLSLST